MTCQGHKSNTFYFHCLLRIQCGIIWIVIHCNCKFNKKLKYFSLAKSWLLNYPLYFFLNKTRLQAQHDQIKDSHFDAVVDQQFQNTVLCTVNLKYQNQIQFGFVYSILLQLKPCQNNKCQSFVVMLDICMSFFEFASKKSAAKEHAKTKHVWLFLFC